MAKKQQDDLKFTLNSAIESALETLNNVWAEIGIVGDQRKTRLDTVMTHILALLEEMVKEEKSLRARLLQNAEKFGEELLRLSKELGRSPFEPPEGLTLLQLEKDLRTRLNTLEVEKHERLKKMKDLHKEDQRLCDVLCATPYYIPSGVVPSLAQLKELQEHISSLEAEKSCRTTLFKSTKENILKMLDELEQCPNTSFERDIICEEEDSFLLSNENMKALKHYYDHLEKKQKENFALSSKLRDRMETLWERLQIPAEERNSFNTNNTGFKRHVIQALRDEISRCELLKLQNIRQVVEATRTELTNLWDDCYYSRKQREQFTPFTSESFTEELLEEHDREVQNVKQYYNENREILERVAKRQVLWKDFLEFERKANDKTRFFNRGCNLLKEEKARKKIEKELPRVEEEVKELLQIWEDKHGSPFLVGGVSFTDFIADQWERFKHDKENEKLQRVQARAKETEEEMRYGSKPKTPAKRPLGTTPGKTPTKLRKLNDTCKTPNSRLGRTNHTSLYSPVCMPPRSVGKPKTQRTPGEDLQRKVLGEKQQSAAPSNDTVFSHTTVSSGGSGVGGPTVNVPEPCRVDPDASTASLASIGAYHDFARGLNQNARPNCRSSVMPKRTAYF